jgi:EAL domain-containing protein (putative c-di-GMP-specific phosphodiesterase class I)
MVSSKGASAVSAMQPSRESVRVEAERALERIEGALVAQAPSMVFQPVVDIRTGETVGAEALARFHMEPRRTPDLWFEEAWAVGLGLELEIAAIQRALGYLGEMPAGTYVAINTAPATLCSDALADALRPFPLERVVVELTEHTRVDDYAALIAAITRLRDGGARLSVDDAGAGFSSFQHVLRLHPNVIKLDRSLTTKLDENPIRGALAAALVTFAASLDAQICAEGIETAGELAALQRLGVAYGQGYLLGRPAPLPLPPMPDVLWTSRYALGTYFPSPAVRSPARLDALTRTDLLDSEDEEDFDRFTRLAVKLLGVPAALVTLVDNQRQFFKSAVGLGEPATRVRGTPLTHSFCQHAVTTRLPLIIDDARLHPLVRDSGAVADFGVAAYAGIPIITADGQALGALCAVDSKVRNWTTEEVSLLEDLTALLVAQIELRRLRRL